MKFEAAYFVPCDFGESRTDEAAACMRVTQRVGFCEQTGKSGGAKRSFPLYCS